MSPEQTPHCGLDVSRQLSLAVSFVGTFLLVGYLAGQINEGSASGWMLIIGAACFICGLIVALLFSILTRLHRIEQRISGSSATIIPKEPNK